MTCEELLARRGCGQSPSLAEVNEVLEHLESCPACAKLVMESGGKVKKQTPEEQERQLDLAVSVILDLYFEELERQGIPVVCPACQGTGLEDEYSNCPVCLGFRKVVPWGYKV